MRRDQFIEQLITEVSVGGLLPSEKFLNEKEINRIIDQAKRYFYLYYKTAVKPYGFVIPRSVFQTDAFKRNRTLILPDEIIAVEDCKELKARLHLYSDASIAEGLLTSQLYLQSVSNSYDLVMRAAYEQYYDIAKSYMLEKITYNFNKLEHVLTLQGRNPEYDVWIQTSTMICENELFEDYWFTRYCSAMTKKSLSNVLLFLGDGFSLPNGAKFSVDNFNEQANEELEKIEEKLKELDPPDWLIQFN